MENQKDKPSYIFPKGMAGAMAKVDQRTQYEASMLSMTLMSVGLIVSIIYAMFFMDIPMWFKVVTAINGLLGVVFMWGYIIMTYQQYLSYMQFVELQQMELAINQANVQYSSTQQSEKGGSYY